MRFCGISRSVCLGIDSIVWFTIAAWVVSVGGRLRASERATTQDMPSSNNNGTEIMREHQLDSGGAATATAAAA
jgi:hypothetical protein